MNFRSKNKIKSGSTLEFVLHLSDVTHVGYEVEVQYVELLNAHEKKCRFPEHILRHFNTVQSHVQFRCLDLPYLLKYSNAMI